MTAIEWLLTYLPQIDYGNDPYYIDIIKEAKKIEKQQIIDAHGIKKDYSFSQIDPQTITGEQYYNKTYKNTNK